MASNSVSASPSPKSPEISEKSKKYDRQLRLWGDHGQSKLELSRICLINANATGTEILKSLVLPGCGSFTIIDNQPVTQEDLGNNFFLDVDSAGKNRGACAAQLLCELNPDVNGDAMDDQTGNILSQDPKFFTKFNVVIASQLNEKDLINLSKNLWQHRIPFIYCQSIGFIGWIRVQLNEHKIIESHPENVKHDLRLDVPFPELISYMDTAYVVGGEEGTEILKMPWLVVLFKAIQNYMKDQQAENGNAQNGSKVSGRRTHPCHMRSAEKSQFKEYLKTFLKELKLPENEQLFEETMKAVHVALTPTDIPSDVKKILEDPKAQVPEASLFWVMAKALAQFVQANGCLPVSGTLPDMRAESQKYINLQNVYRERAARDAEDIIQRCHIIAQESNLQNIRLKPDEVRLFCKDAHHLKLVRGTPLFQELESSPSIILNELAQNVEEMDEDKLFYLMLRGVLRFQATYSTYPGALLEHEPDITRLKSLMNSLVNEWNSPLIVKDDYIHEICRYGASEIPSVAGFIGGCVAQEAIKILTSQYVPLNNTLIYNAINSTTSAFVM